MARIIEEDGCFAVLENDGELLVSEELHDHRPGPLTWRVPSRDLADARASIDRARPCHDETYHTAAVGGRA